LESGGTFCRGGYFFRSVTELSRVPFDISGSAILDEDYTMSATEFTLQPGEMIDTIWVTPKENVIRREIRLSLQEVPKVIAYGTIVGR
ncbi:MAG: hypothetical protein V8R91_00990, partial [Butyricimonas faecihominis]